MHHDDLSSPTFPLDMTYWAMLMALIHVRLHLQIKITPHLILKLFLQENYGYDKIGLYFKLFKPHWLALLLHLSQLVKLPLKLGQKLKSHLLIILTPKCLLFYQH